MAYDPVLTLVRVIFAPVVLLKSMWFAMSDSCVWFASATLIFVVLPTLVRIRVAPDVELYTMCPEISAEDTYPL